jgi:spermidine synthase
MYEYQEEHIYSMVVAFCSFIYELGYSELLNVLYGGGAKTYATTIGIYMFSLGVGVVVTQAIKGSKRNLQLIETYMAFGPFGFLFIVAIAIFDAPIFISYLPIALVGFFSGMEIPILIALVDSRDPLVARIASNLKLSVLGFELDKSQGVGSELSDVLALDYVGSLIGAVGFSLFLYPKLGLVTTIVIAGLLNSLVALFVAIRYSETFRILLVISLLLSVVYTGAILNSNQMEREVSRAYASDMIMSDYQDSDVVDIKVTEQLKTRHQRVTWYERDYIHDNISRNQMCLRLDEAIQLCERWIDSYHRGAVDIPMTLFEEQENVSVLLVGGGDWIAVNRLQKYNATIDQVDIDKQFYTYAKNNSVLERYHHNSYKYEKLETHSENIFNFLDNNKKQYDMIILDIPGARSTDSIPLYSLEFYRALHSHLSKDGAVVSWSYYWDFTRHNTVKLETLRQAGFEQYDSYFVYDDIDGDNQKELGEKFQVYAKSDLNRTVKTTTEKDTWNPIPNYPVKSNSIFSPNYDIVVDY